MLLVDGNYAQWGPWADCDMKTFDTRRERTCQGIKYGGKCEGEPEESKKCGEKYDSTLTMVHVDKGPLEVLGKLETPWPHV